MIERTGDRPAPRRRSPRGGRERPEEASASIGAELSATRRELQRFVRLELARITLAAHEATGRLAWAALALAAGGVLALLGTAFAVVGVVNGLSSAFNPWIGQLGGGLIALLLAALGIGIWHWRRDERLVKRLLDDRAQDDDKGPTNEERGDS